MNTFRLEQGFKFWRDEVDGLERPEKMTPYIPAIALVGIYTAAIKDPELLNSYNWRQAVLQNDDAIKGMFKSVSSLHNDRIYEEFEMPVDLLKPEEDERVALQHVCAYASLMDGLPQGVTHVPDKEMFLAETLGHAEHDYGVTFHPLRLAAGGLETIRNNYPRTFELVGSDQ